MGRSPRLGGDGFPEEVALLTRRESFFPCSPGPPGGIFQVFGPPQAPQKLLGTRLSSPPSPLSLLGSSAGSPLLTRPAVLQTLPCPSAQIPPAAPVWPGAGLGYFCSRRLGGSRENPQGTRHTPTPPHTQDQLGTGKSWEWGTCGPSCHRHPQDPLLGLSAPGGLSAGTPLYI